MKSEEEAAWIWSEYRDCGLFAAIDRFAKDVSGMDGMPAGHPSLLFYLAVYAIDDIKCIGNQGRRLVKCRNLKNDIVHYLKTKGYDNHKELAAEIIYCVRYGLVALSYSRCINEIRIMSEHINELIHDPKLNAEIRRIARSCFGDDEFKEWFKGYYDGRDFISETIISKVKEMRKANLPKGKVSIHRGRGNRNRELFSDESVKQKMMEELKGLFSGRGLKMTNVEITNDSKEYDCIFGFYAELWRNGKIDHNPNPRGYIRFLLDVGIKFAASEKNAENKLRKNMIELMG